MILILDYFKKYDQWIQGASLGIGDILQNLDGIIVPGPHKLVQLEKGFAASF